MGKFDIDGFLKKAVAIGASYVHLRVEEHPAIRKDGKIKHPVLFTHYFHHLRWRVNCIFEFFLYELLTPSSNASQFKMPLPRSGPLSTHHKNKQLYSKPLKHRGRGTGPSPVLSLFIDCGQRIRCPTGSVYFTRPSRQAWIRPS